MAYSDKYFPRTADKFWSNGGGIITFTAVMRSSSKLLLAGGNPDSLSDIVACLRAKQQDVVTSIAEPVR